MPDDIRAESAAASVAVLLLAAIALLMGVDLASDWARGSAAGHLVVESLVMALALGGAVHLWRSRQDTWREAAALGRDLGRARAGAARWREEARELLDGLSGAIDRQMERWELSPAEREVCLLLLKGLSLKEVAAVRGTSSGTTRQQSLAVYRKSGLAGRSELAAFFLEDLLTPLRPSRSGTEEHPPAR